MKGVIFAAAMVVAATEAHAQGFMSWGFESSGCTQQNMFVQAGNGADIYLTSLTGSISASLTSLPGDPNTQYQALVSVSSNPPLPVSGFAAAPTTELVHNEVDGGLYGVVFKLPGAVGHAIVPVNVPISPAIRVPGGSLTAWIDLGNYAAQGETPDQSRCLNVEGHLLLQWRSSP